MQHNPVKAQKVARPALLILSILLIATTLRAPITGVAPLLDLIRASFGLSVSESGLLITLPLLAFAIISPFAAGLAREYGLERSLFMALCMVVIGIACRSSGPVWALFLGTLIIGSGVAIINVLLPSLLKRDFPNKASNLTALYALTMGAAAALFSVVAIPLANASALGWRLALGVIVVLPIISLLLWTAQLRSRTLPTKDVASPPHGGRVWHSPIAWQVTLFFGFNSCVNYAMISWLPAILQDAGYSATQAGSLHGLFQLAAAVPVLVMIPFIGRLKNQSLAAFGSAIMATTGPLGLLLAPSWATLWIMLLGCGVGAAFILALSFLSLRAGTVQQAAALSGMAQSIGYLLSAAAPPFMGALHQGSGNWHVGLLLCTALCLVMAVIGLYAGRAVKI